jgi:ribonuclease VapC
MTVVDTSALLAILLGEPERDRFRAMLDEAPDAVLSIGSLIEARMVARGRGGDPMVEMLDILVEQAEIALVSVDAEQADIAHTAFVRYGKGNGHPAQLNFGDLFSYALAKSRGLPLLFKGDDFARTDIEAAT